MILIVLLYGLFATSFSMGKLLLTYTSPIFLAGIRMSLAGSILLFYQYFFAHQHFKFRTKHLFLYAQLIFFGIYVTYILRFWALSYLPSFKTSFLYNFSPFFAWIYSYIFFNESITTKKATGLFIGFCGMIPMLLTGSTAETALGEWYFISWPEFAVIVSVASHSYSWIIMRKLVRDKSYAPSMVNGISMLIGGLLALVTSLFVENYTPIENPLPFFSLLGLVIIISNIICYNLYAYLLKSYTATFLAFAGFLSPLFAALYGKFFLHETISWHFYCSSIIVFIGLYLFYQEELYYNQDYEHTFDS